MDHPRKKSGKGPQQREKSQFIKKDRPIQILDVLLHGHLREDVPLHKQRSLVQLISLEDFVLYEVEIPKSSTIKVQDLGVYGDFKDQNQLGRVLKKIDHADLTPMSKALLDSVLQNRINEKKEEFLYFFNNSCSITPRLHQLQLIPGVGKTIMWEIINARNKKPFESFEDLKNRTSISDPTHLIVKLIAKELTRDVKYYVFSKTKRYEEFKQDFKRQSSRYDRRPSYLRRDKF